MGEQKTPTESEAVVDHDDGVKVKQLQTPPPPLALNHVSRLCTSVEDSVDFYVNVLGFYLTNRPTCFNFEGAWLFNYGVGIHLMKRTEGSAIHDASPDRLDPMDNHISFQCEDMDAMERKLKDMGIEYVKRTIDADCCKEENDSRIDQLFFNDPDGFMIEICNCDKLKIVPVGASLLQSHQARFHHNQQQNMYTTSNLI